MKNYDVTIDYVDEIRCKIITRKEIFHSLRDTYSFYANGYKFHPLYKQGVWNGKINMIDGKGLFYNGLLKDLARHCKQKGISIKVNNLEKYKADTIDDSVIDNLTSYIKFKPYDYQLAAVKRALSVKKILTLSPTSSGKSAISYLLYRYCVDNNIPLLITVPSTTLVEQLYSDFESYVLDDHKVSDYVTTLYSGKEKYTDHLVVISTWQSCINMEKEWFSRFGFYICDEAHQSNGKSLSAIIDNMPNCKYRVGMTGTLNGTDIHEIELQARFGDIYKTITTRELIDRGLVTDILINVVNLKYPKETVDRFSKYTGGGDYQKEIDFLINCESRNKYITNLALNLKTNSLVLFNRIDAHGMKLYDILKTNSVKNMKKIFYIAGSVKAKDRESIRHAMDSDLPIYYKLNMENGSSIILDGEFFTEENIIKYKHELINQEDFCQENSYFPPGFESSKLIGYEKIEGAYILLATYGTLSTGVNIKNLHNLIFAHPFKGKILNLQSIGRILRKSSVKNKVYLYDLVDDFRKGRKSNHTYKHGALRLEIYEDQEFDYEITTLQLD